MRYNSKRELLEKLIPVGSIVLDVGFVGQGVTETNPDSSHQILKKRGEVYGFDLKIPKEYVGDPHYQEASAEDFHFPVMFDVIYAGDLIEHLSNPGLFLQCCKKHLKPGGKLILTTPNAFCLDNIAGKMMRTDPVVNPDHTLYLNPKVVRILLRKNGLDVESIDYIDDSEAYTFKRSFKKRLLDLFEKGLRLFTDKFTGGIVITSKSAS